MTPAAPAVCSPLPPPTPAPAPAATSVTTTPLVVPPATATASRLPTELYGAVVRRLDWPSRDEHDRRQVLRTLTALRLVSSTMDAVVLQQQPALVGKLAAAELRAALQPPDATPNAAAAAPPRSTPATRAPKATQARATATKTRPKSPTTAAPWAEPAPMATTTAATTRATAAALATAARPITAPPAAPWLGRSKILPLSAEDGGVDFASPDAARLLRTATHVEKLQLRAAPGRWPALLALPLERLPRVHTLACEGSPRAAHPLSLLRLPYYDALRTLQLRHVAFDAAHLPLVASRQLTHLELTHNRLGPAGARLLPLHALPQLQTLIVAYNDLGCAGASLLPLQDAPQLVRLHLPGNRLGRGAATLALAGLQQLRLLDLENNGIDADGASLEALVQLPALQALWLGDNALGAGGAAKLPLRRLPGLRQLMLRNCLLESDGANALPLARLRRLTRLDLSFNHLTPSRRPLLSPKLLARLQHVDLRFNELTHADVDALLRKAGARRRADGLLDVTLNPLSVDEVAALNAAFPGALRFGADPDAERFGDGLAESTRHDV